MSPCNKLNKKLQDQQQRQIDRLKNDGNHEAAIKAMIKLGDDLMDERKFQESLKVFSDAKEYLSSVAVPLTLHFKVDRAILDLFIQTENDRLLPSLTEFIERYQDARLTVKEQQDFHQIVSFGFCALKQYDQAEKYSLKTLQLLNPKLRSYEYHKALIYAILFEVNFYYSEYDLAKKYLRDALQCKKIKKDIFLYFQLLFSKCELVDRPQKLEHALKRHEWFCRFQNGKLKEKKFDIFYCLAEAYLIQKDTLKAEECFWNIFKDEDALKQDKKNISKFGLVTLYKVGKRIEEVSKLEAEDVKPVIFLNLYEKVAVDFHNLEAYELSFEWYSKMKNVASIIGNAELNKTILKAMTDCIYNFASTQEEFQESLNLHFELLQMYKQNFDVPDSVKLAVTLKFTDAILALDNVEFKDKITVMLKTEEKEKTPLQAVIYLTKFIKLLEKNKENDEAPQYMHKIPELKNLLKENRKTMKPLEHQRRSCTPDQYDAIPDVEILRIVKEKWKRNDGYMAWKNKINQKNKYGETELHQAVLRNSTLDHIKFLVEECDYQKILNVQDGNGKTALFYAVSERETEIAKYFIKKSANLDFVTDSKDKSPGTSVLHEAIYQRNVEIIRRLILRNANPMQKNYMNQTPLDLLKELIRFGNACKNGTPFPSRFKKMEPVSAEQLKQLIKIKKKLKEAEQKWIAEHGISEDELLSPPPPKRLRSG